MYKIIAVIIFLSFCSCNAAKPTTAEVVTNAPAPTPMSCIADMQVMEVLKPDNTDSGSVCSRYPCRARVKIEDIHSCGSSVSLPVNPGDIIEMEFTHTLADTRKVFPEMRIHYPGLKKGKHITATIEQRLAPGTDGYFIVNHYTIK